MRKSTVFMCGSFVGGFQAFAIFELGGPIWAKILLSSVIYVVCYHALQIAACENFNEETPEKDHDII